MTKPLADDGRRRVVIESVVPAVDGGRFPVKRVVGDRMIVEADIFADGHDTLRCVLQYRKQGARSALPPKLCAPMPIRRSGASLRRATNSLP